MGELSLGLYEQLMTRRLAGALAEGGSEISGLLENLDPADSHQTLAHHLFEILSRFLRGLPAEERIARQAAVCNRVIELLSSEDPTNLDTAAAEIEIPAKLLMAITEGKAQALAFAVARRPTIPLTQSALLVNGRGEPSIGAEIGHELESSDAVDLLCAFIKFYGVRIIREPLQRFVERGGLLRVITTTYMGATERRAVDELHALGATIKISYETNATRLHAKAWLFERRSGFSTGYIGSSNLSKSALIDGLEWNVRVTERDTPDILEKFRATFESYWLNETFEPYDPVRDGARLDLAVRQSVAAETSVTNLEIHARPHQQRILDDLEAERERHGFWRNLVVAATGSGKTVVAALDYRRLSKLWGKPSLLFVAHRREILQQSLRTFRDVLHDGAFGELYVDGHRPDEWRHVFASVQSLASLDPTTLDPKHFEIVIVDEFHHAAAATYRKILDHLKPRMLLGLTATPERTDGQSVTEWFDGRYATELRLWDALDEGILCPFHYFGVSDDVDLSSLEWRRGVYDVRQLENVYTGNDARVMKILHALQSFTNFRSIRALGFCVSIKHAEYMAQRFQEAGIPSVAVSAQSSAELRARAMQQLRDGMLNVVFAVDLFNEGVDLPEIDTVLLLRPTESATVFLQQLGRGLRRTEGKSCLTVLDFIGQQHRRFRFDMRYRALTGTTRGGFRHEVEAGFPYLPAGCHIELDRVAQKVVLDNIRQTLRLSARDLGAELRDLGDVSLSVFIEETGTTLQEIYRVGGWTVVRREAGFETRTPQPGEAVLLSSFANILHVDDPARLSGWSRILTRANAPLERELEAVDRRLMTMLHYLVWNGPNRPDSLDLSMQRLWESANAKWELAELLSVLEDRARALTTPIERPVDVPLQIHARYTRDEIIAALGASTAARYKGIREGVYFDKPSSAEAFFVTLEKTDKSFSPTTQYRDFALAPNLFHWESQNKTSEGSSVGRRYVQHRSLGIDLLLFVRERREGSNGTLPYLFLGPVSYVSHVGDRPMAITWRLEHPMPPEFFQHARLAAS